MAKFYYRNLSGFKNAVSRVFKIDYSIDDGNNSTVIYFDRTIDHAVANCKLFNILQRTVRSNFIDTTNRCGCNVTVLVVTQLNEFAPPMPAEFLNKC